MKRALLIAFLAVLGMASVPARAQSVDALDISLDPQYPAPYQVVTVTPSSSTFDMNAATVTISANGAVVNKGSGGETAQVQLGGPGSRTVISVEAVTGDGQTYDAQVAVTPEDVALVTEPQSTTHPFYLGAPLIASSGQVRLVALADFHTASGAAIPASSLVYTWKHDDQTLEDQSGIGKSVLTAEAPPQYRDAQVSVTVSTPDGALVGQASTDVTAVDPVLRVYRNDPLLGPLFSLAIGSAYTMKDSEDTFRAVPYNFASAPAIAWQMNGSAAASSPDLTVRSDGNGSGTAVLDAQASLPDNAQSAEDTLTVGFGGGHPLGIFGL